MEIKFYESTPHMYLHTRKVIEVPAKMELRVRYLKKGITVAEAKDFPIAVLSNGEPVCNFIPKVTEAIIKSAEAEVLPGSADDLDFGIDLQGIGYLVVKLHLIIGTRSIFIASSKYIAGYVMYDIFANSFKRTPEELKELLGIPKDDKRYKF